MIPIGAPLSFLLGALIEPESGDSAGRLVLLASMVVVVGFVNRLLHPSRSVFKVGSKPSLAVKACYLFFLLIPLYFGVITCLGYFASAVTLRSHVIASLQLILLAFLLIRFLGRWILVSRRRLAISQALHRRQVALAEKEAEGAGVERDADLPSLEEVKARAVDVVEVEVQTTQLVRLSVIFATFFAIWGVWANTMPALSVLDRVSLWETGGESTESTADSTAPKLVPGVSLTSQESTTAPAEESESPASDGNTFRGKVTEFVNHRTIV